MKRREFLKGPHNWHEKDFGVVVPQKAALEVGAKLIENGVEMTRRNAGKITLMTLGGALLPGCSQYEKIRRLQTLRLGSLEFPLIRESYGTQTRITDIEGLDQIASLSADEVKRDFIPWFQKLSENEETELKNVLSKIALHAGKALATHKGHEDTAKNFFYLAQILSFRPKKVVDKFPKNPLVFNRQRFDVFAIDKNSQSPQKEKGFVSTSNKDGMHNQRYADYIQTNTFGEAALSLANLTIRQNPNDKVTAFEHFSVAMRAFKDYQQRLADIQKQKSKSPFYREAVSKLNDIPPALQNSIASTFEAHPSITKHAVSLLRIDSPDDFTDAIMGALGIHNSPEVQKLVLKHQGKFDGNWNTIITKDSPGTLKTLPKEASSWLGKNIGQTALGLANLHNWETLQSKSTIFKENVEEAMLENYQKGRTLSALLYQESKAYYPDPIKNIAAFYFGGRMNLEFATNRNLWKQCLLSLGLTDLALLEKAPLPKGEDAAQWKAQIEAIKKAIEKTAHEWIELKGNKGKLYVANRGNDDFVFRTEGFASRHGELMFASGDTEFNAQLKYTPNMEDRAALAIKHFPELKGFEVTDTRDFSQVYPNFFA